MTTTSPIPRASTIASAIAAFQRSEDDTADSNDEADASLTRNPRGGVLIAERVHLKTWLSNNTDVRGAVITAFLNDGATVVDNSTTADLVITKLTEYSPHRESVYEVIGQFGVFAERHEDLVSASGGDMHVIDEIRDPDVVLRPSDDLPNEDSMFDNIPRVIVEVEVAHRTGPGLVRWCQKYFQVPQVRQVIGIKFYPRRSNDNRFAALAMQFGRVRDEHGVEAIDVVDAVSFGTANLGPGANLPQEAKNHLRVLRPRVTQDDIAARRNP